MEWREILWPWGAVERQKNAIRWLENEVIRLRKRVVFLELEASNGKQPRDSRGRFIRREGPTP